MESGGDPARGWTPTDATVKEEPNYVFETMNRGKRGIALDLSQDKGREVLYRLCQQADVFITNLRLSTLDKLKVNYESIKKLILTSCTCGARDSGRGAGEGQDGVRFHRILGTFGNNGIDRGPGRGTRQDEGVARRRVDGNVFICGDDGRAIQEERTGEGGLVDGSLLATGTWVAAENLWAPLRTGKTPPKYSRKSPPNPLVNIYNTSDNRWIYMTVLQETDSGRTSAGQLEEKT